MVFAIGFDFQTVKDRHCEERSDEAIQLSFAKEAGLLRGACHRARIRATRWLAMTTEHTSAFPRRDASELCIYFPPEEGVGNAGRPMHPQPGGQKRVDSRTSSSHHEFIGNTRHSRTQWF